MPLSLLSSISSEVIRSKSLPGSITSASFVTPTTLGSISIQNIVGRYTSFTVSRTGGGLANFTSAVINSPTNSYTDPTALVNNAQYTYTITPKNYGLVGTVFSAITNSTTALSNSLIYTLATTTGLSPTYNGAGSSINTASFTFTGTNNGTTNNYTKLSIQYPNGTAVSTPNFVLGANTFTSGILASKNTQYLYYIYAVNGDNLTNATSITINTCTWADITAAAFVIPNVLGRIYNGTSTMTGIAGTFTSYTLTRTGGVQGTYTLASQTGSTVTDLTTGLTNNTAYTYTLTPINALAYASTAFTGITGSTTAGVIYTLASAVMVPTLVNASGSTTSVYMTWTNTGYSSIRIQNTTLPGTVTTYTTASVIVFYNSSGKDTLATNTQYTYTFTAVNGDGVYLVGTTSTTLNTCTWASAPTLTYSGAGSSTTQISFSYSGGTFTSLSIQTTLGTQITTITSSPYTSPLNSYAANVTTTYYACPVNSLGYYSTTTNYASVSTCTWGTCNTPTFSSTTATGTTLGCTGTFSKVLINYTGPAGTPVSGFTVTGTNSISQAYTGMTTSTLYTFTCFPVNVLNYQSSNSTSAGVTPSTTQPVVTGGTLLGLYNFNTSVTSLPSPGNGVAPSLRVGSATISTSIVKIGAGSLSTLNTTENQVYLGAYTFTANTQFSIAFWFRPIRTTLLNNVGAFNISSSSTPANQFITIVQNNNANPTNNVRFAIFGYGSANPTNLLITDSIWTHFVIVYNGQTYTVYINGSLNSSYTFVNAVTNTNVWYFSLASNCNGSNQRGSMFIDEFRIYNGLLNATDASNIYNWTA